jgi:hypothetical protein
MDERKRLRKKYFRMYYRKNRHRLLTKSKVVSRKKRGSVELMSEFEVYVIKRKKQLCDEGGVVISFV